MSKSLRLDIAALTTQPIAAEPVAERGEAALGNDGKQWPQTFDAQAWAKMFNVTLVELGHQPHDEGWLIGWFANAIMRGFDEHAWRNPTPSPEVVTVPREPTEAMMEAGGDEHWRVDKDGNMRRAVAAQRIYKAMLAAAPVAQREQS